MTDTSNANHATDRTIAAERRQLDAYEAGTLVKAWRESFWPDASLASFLGWTSDEVQRFTNTGMVPGQTSINCSNDRDPKPVGTGRFVAIARRLWGR